VTEAWLRDLLADEDLPPDFADAVEAAHRPVADRIAAAAKAGGTLVVGLCGPQGSGKSTMAKSLRAILAGCDLRAAVLSLDDLYLTRAERGALAASVHPLLRTRGVPGTHDLALGHAVLDALAEPGEARLPVFDKALDDRCPPEAWARVSGPADVVLFEGWCVGAVPQGPAELAEPVNDLEREEDPDGTWRRYVNDALGTGYRRLFARIGLLVVLEPPGFDVVLGWRTEQERKRRSAALVRGEAPGGMTDAEIARFVAHYERLTRHILAEMPARADVTVRLDEHRRPTIVTGPFTRR